MGPCSVCKLWDCTTKTHCSNVRKERMATHLWEMEMARKDDQLKDVMITIASTEMDDAGKPYAVTNVYRYDLQGSIVKFIRHICESKDIIEGGQMVNK